MQYFLYQTEAKNFSFWKLVPWNKIDTESKCEIKILKFANDGGSKTKEAKFKNCSVLIFRKSTILTTDLN